MKTVYIECKFDDNDMACAESCQGCKAWNDKEGHCIFSSKAGYLMACPFCGCHEAGTVQHNGYWSVKCGYMHDGTPSEHCFQEWGNFETEEEAIRAWNTRII